MQDVQNAKPSGAREYLLDLRLDEDGTLTAACAACRGRGVTGDELTCGETFICERCRGAGRYEVAIEPFDEDDLAMETDGPLCGAPTSTEDNAMQRSNVFALPTEEAGDLYELAAALLEMEPVTRRPALYAALMAFAADLEDALNAADPLRDERIDLAVSA